MSFSTRTEAEKSRAKQLSPSTVSGVRREYTTSSPNLTKLDLSCLPVETNFRLAVVQMDGKAADHIEEDSGSIMMDAELRVVDGTLRQAKWMRQGQAGKNWMGIELNMTGTSGRKRTVNIRPDGSSGSMYAMYVRDVEGSHTHDLKEFRSKLTKEILWRLIMPQHMLRFPATYHGRDNVSFLGLPQGTIVPLKNGGKFEVNCRTNVTVESDGSANGHLHLVPLDDKARHLADSMGWGEQKLLGKDGYLVHPNLYTAKTSGRNFDIANIRCPYADPTKDMPSVFVSGVPHEVDMTTGYVKPTISKKVGWAATPEELAEQLDDFLFG